jgi:hypothetical protein
MRSFALSCLFLLCLAISSCTRIILAFYGGHLPRCENEQTIRQYLNKENLSDDNVFIIADSSSWQELWHRFNSLPEIYYFNRNGYHLLLRDSTQCNNENYLLLTALDTVRHDQIDSTFTFNMFISKLRTLDGKEINTDQIEKPDLYLAITWAVFMGQAVEKVKDWEKMLDTLDTGLKIKAFKVNFDVQDSWGCVAGDKIGRGKIKGKM